MADDRLYVCETCLRDEIPPPGEATRGRRLAGRIEAALAALPAGAPRPLLRRVACLNACLSPCSVALRAGGKESLRLSRLEPAEAESLARLALAYCRSADGRLAEADWPDGLRAKLSARSPAPPGPLTQRQRP